MNGFNRPEDKSWQEESKSKFVGLRSGMKGLIFAALLVELSLHHSIMLAKVA
jgi:hypothetical protein